MTKDTTRFLYGRRKPLHGVGINDADYLTEKREIWYEDGKKRSKLIWNCPVFLCWRNMIIRCYSKSALRGHPSYRNCTVSSKWHLFSEFSKWYLANHPDKLNTKDYHLDKDILQKGNKVYCPEYCVFVPVRVNTFLTERGADRGEYPLGVVYHKSSGKFHARCNNPFTNKTVSLGLHFCQEDAHQAWKMEKLKFTKQLIKHYRLPENIAKALILRYS